MIELRDTRSDKVLSFRKKCGGKTPEQLAAAAKDRPLREVFSRPTMYRRHWTAHYLLDRGDSGSVPMVINHKLCSKIKDPTQPGRRHSTTAYGITYGC